VIANDAILIARAKKQRRRNRRRDGTAYSGVAKARQRQDDDSNERLVTDRWRILTKRTNLGIPNEINAIRFLVRKTRGSLAAGLSHRVGRSLSSGRNDAALSPAQRGVIACTKSDGG